MTLNYAMDKQSEPSDPVILIDDQTLDCIFRILTQAKEDLRTAFSVDRETGKMLNSVPVGRQYKGSDLADLSVKKKALVA